jgi:hypothetical protein
MVLQQADIDGPIKDIGGIGFFIIIIGLSLLTVIFAFKAGIWAVKGQNTEMGQVFITAFFTWLISALCTWLLPFGWLIGLIIALVIIMKRHETTFFGALGAILIAFIVLILLLFLIFFLLGASLLGLMGLNSILP